MIKENLKIDHRLFQRLRDNHPLWWDNLKSDVEIYIDVRKDNYLNIYHNGGSIMRLKGANKYIAEIHFEYMPMQNDKEYMPFLFHDENISFTKTEPIELNDFSEEVLMKIKKRIRKFYPNSSEKGIQGKYVVYNNNIKENNDGFFIDTEYQYSKNGRIDMVWVDLTLKKIVFVELKTIGDDRLYISKNYEDKNGSTEKIDLQLAKYSEFITKNKSELINYYNKVFLIKKELGILPGFAYKDSLLDYQLIEKPILLVGDCTQEWIDNNAKKLNKEIADVAFASLYQGKSTFSFKVPDRTSRNCFLLSKI